MNLSLPIFSAPLLARELNGRANRWQHYAARVAFAALLFATFLWLKSEELAVFAISDLGRGKTFLVILLGLQVFGIGLFLPAMMCGAIAREVECNSLTQLLLTPMSPTSIVLQKFVGGLLPVLTLLLLASPLYAVAYGYGGISPRNLAWGFGMLVLLCMQVGAFALLWSACCKHTTTAFVLTYVTGAAGALASGTITEVCVHIFGSTPEFHFWPNAFTASIANPYAFGTGLAIYSGAWWTRVFVHLCSLPILFVGTCLLLTIWRLKREVGVKPRAKVRWNERWPAQMLDRMNAWFGGVHVRGRGKKLPNDKPIARRDGRQFGLGDGVGMLRMGLWLAVPALLLLLVPALDDRADFYRPTTWYADCINVFAGLGALAIVGHSAMALAGERASQTLEVLLATPMAAREIVWQKSRLCWRLQAIFFVPLLILYAGEAVRLQRFGGHDRLVDSGWALGLAALPGLIAYPRVIGWASLYLGLRFRRPRLALLVGLSSVLALVLVPLWYIDPILTPLITGSTDWWKVLTYAASPTLFQLLRSQRHFYYEIGDLWPMTLVLHTLFYLALAWIIRALCLAQAERALRR